jgi:hypothetical protein
MLIFDRMRNFKWMVWWCAILVTACDQGGGPTQVDILEPCAELDSLFQTLGTMDSMLVNGAAWEACDPYLQASLTPLTRNQRPENKDCNYLDQRYRPDEPRLLWVENLRSRIETDTIPEGIYYLLRWRGVFKHDPEISEFFSEELSYVAMNNPACYWGYLQQNPDQEVMLLYSTKWNTMDLDTLMDRFSRIPKSEPVLHFLINLQEQKNDGL